MARSLTAVKISVEQILEAADRVGQIGGDDLTKAAVSTLNEVMGRTYDLARQRITASINLSDSYVRTRFELDPASAAKLQATITARGGKSDMTRLMRYDGQMVVAPMKSRRKSRATGRLGLAPGMKQAGVTVQVRVGDTKEVQKGFLMPLRAGGQDGQLFGVFKRRNGKIEHLYGPAVYQLFRYQADAIGDEVADDLEATMMEYVDRKTQGALE